MWPGVLNEAGGAPAVALDNAVVGDKEENTSQEQADTEEGSVKILIVMGSHSKSVFGHVVPKKGIDKIGFAVDAIVEDAKWPGYTKMCLNIDHQPAILKLLVESLRG